MVSKNPKAKPLIFVFCLNFYFKSSCMIQMAMYGGLKEKKRIKRKGGPSSF